MNSEIPLPLRHISIRVPWHDSGWNGTVCLNPQYNSDCLSLPSISENRDDSSEVDLAGRQVDELDSHQTPPCVRERGTFMAPFAFEKSYSHPYAETQKDLYSHFKTTYLRYPSYSAPALPFRWFMKPVIFGGDRTESRPLTDEYPLNDLDQRYEPDLPFKTHWIQDHRNQRALLETFWEHVRVEQSLVFFYAKQVPLIENVGRRVLVGVGRVK